MDSKALVRSFVRLIKKERKKTKKKKSARWLLLRSYTFSQSTDPSKFKGGGGN